MRVIQLSIGSWLRSARQTSSKRMGMWSSSAPVACWIALPMAGATEIIGLVLDADQGIVGRSVQANAGCIVRDAAQDPDFHRGVDTQTGFTTRSILCAPMSVRDERIGAIELVNKRGGDGLFDVSDLAILQGLISSAALAIVNARQAQALVEQERVTRELELATEIQRSLLPKARPEPFPVHGVNVPARVVSGDFFDFFEREDGAICFALGDVSGKGMNAALMMAKTASLFRCLGKTETSPGRLLAVINREICETATRGMFVTMVGGVFDPGTGRVRLANAGHEPPLRRDRDGRYRALPAEAPPLGILPLPGPDGYPETEMDLNGGTLYLFSDGVTEGYVGDERTLGVGGLTEILDASARMPVADRLHAVIARLHRSSRPLRDDLTLLAVNDGGPASQSVGEGLLRLAFPSRPSELKGVREAIAAVLDDLDCPEEAVRDCVTAVDEACQNVIRHAYGGDPDGQITLDIRRDGDDLIFRCATSPKRSIPARSNPVTSIRCGPAASVPI